VTAPDGRHARRRALSLHAPVLVDAGEPCMPSGGAPIVRSGSADTVRAPESGRSAAPQLGGRPVRCPFCRTEDSRVVDSRTADDGASIRRRRQCQHCGRRFTTVETSSLTVVKRSGATEPFSREKVIAGVRKACQGRPVSEDDLALLAQQVEESIRSTGAAEVDAHEVGLTILGPLRELDEVAYLRFASVYRAFSSLEDFEAAINALRADRNGDVRPRAVSGR
jgi:transcriptional repressor NrdR